MFHSTQPYWETNQGRVIFSLSGFSPVLPVQVHVSVSELIWLLSVWIKWHVIIITEVTWVLKEINQNGEWTRTGIMTQIGSYLLPSTGVFFLVFLFWFVDFLSYPVSTVSDRQDVWEEDRGWHAAEHRQWVQTKSHCSLCGVHSTRWTIEVPLSTGCFLVDSSWCSCSRVVLCPHLLAPAKVSLTSGLFATGV